MGWWTHCKPVALILVGGAVAWNGIGVAARPGLTRRTYGVAVDDDPDLMVLLRHRAVLLAVSGMLLAVSAVRPELRVAATAAAATGMASFVAFSAAMDVNSQQRQVASVDVILLVLLAAASIPARSATRDQP